MRILSSYHLIRRSLKKGAETINKTNATPLFHFVVIVHFTHNMAGDDASPDLLRSQAIFFFASSLDLFVIFHFRGKPHHHLTHDATQCSSARERKKTQRKNNETEKRHEIKLMACCEIRIMIMMWRNSRDERPEIGGHCSGRTIDILIYILHS